MQYIPPINWHTFTAETFTTHAHTYVNPAAPWDWYREATITIAPGYNAHLYQDEDGITLGLPTAHASAAALAAMLQALEHLSRVLETLTTTPPPPPASALSLSTAPAVCADLECVAAGVAVGEVAA